MSAVTPGELTDAIRAHHRALADTLNGYAADVEASATNTPDTATLSDLLDHLTAFLSDDLLPHARGEERALYPALDPVIREHGTPTATMSVDHEYIGSYVKQIAETAGAIRAASGDDRANLVRKLDRLTLQLQGLFSVHLAKEERIYLPLVERVISAGDQRALLAALHDEAGNGERHMDRAAGAGTETLDVRSLPPTRRHQIIFQRFDELTTGGSFVLANDHDPKPLYYQLVAEYPGKLAWDYLEQGPEVWRVRIGKAS